MKRPKLVATPLDRAVWAACPYVDSLYTQGENKIRECNKCPAYEVDKDEPKEKYVRACRAMTEELLIPALEAYNQDD